MEQKSSVHYVTFTKSSAQNGISTGDVDMEILLETGLSTAYINPFK